MAELNEKLSRVLNYLRNYIEENGFPPTVREICSELEIKSTATVYSYLERLKELGYLKKSRAKNRALEVVDKKKASFKTVPLVGRVTAGTPILAEENIEDSFPIPARYVGKGNHFMLMVKGDSMIEAGIFDGDYILVQQKQTANNGEIVVAMVDGFESEATVKTFYKENGHIRLQPENQNMSPIIVKDVKILGLVKGVFRYLS